MAILSPDELQQLIEQVLSSDVLLRPERSTDGLSDVTGHVTVDGKEVRIGIMFGPTFPLSLPILLAYPWDALGFIPHVVPISEKLGAGFICYQDSEGTVLDRQNPFGLVEEAVELASGVLRDGMSGRNRKDFAEEWENHWSRTATSPSWWAVGDVPTRTSVMNLYRIRDGETLFLARDVSALTSFRRVAPETAGRKVLFVPLAERTEPVAPLPLGPVWTGSEVRAFIRDHLHAVDLAQVLKKAQRLRDQLGRRSVESVVFSLPRPSGGLTLFGIEFSDVRGKHPFLHGRYGEVRHVAVHRWDRPYIVPRGGANGTLGSKRVLVIGCGAVGSRIAVELARSGVLRLTLVDPDDFAMENVFRHVLGRSSVGKNKAGALKTYLNAEIPYADVDAVGESIHAALSSGAVDFSDFDLVVCALGNPTIEMDLNEQLWGGQKAPTVYSWVEPYGIGGHALLVRPGKRGCFECLYTPPGEQATVALVNRSAFAGPPPEGRTYGKALSGCGSLFTPYGSADAAQSALLAVRLGVGVLTGEGDVSPLLSWKGDAAAFEREGFAVTGRHRKSADQLEAERYGHVSSGCAICKAAE